MGVEMSVKFRISKWIVNPIIGILIAMGTNHSLYTYMAVLLAAASIVLYNEQDSLCTLFFCMSFAFVFKAAPKSTSFFTMLMLLYVLWNMLKIRRFHWTLSGIILLVEYVTVVHLANGMMQLTQLIKFAVNLLFLYVAVQNIDTNHPRELFLTYVFGVLFSSFLKLTGVFPRIPLYTQEPVEYARFTGMQEDPNYYGVNLIISLCLVAILYHRKELSVGITIVLEGLLIWFCAQSASKMVLLMLLFPVMLFLYSNFKNRRIGLQLLFLGLLIAIVFLVLQGKIKAFDMVFSRMKAANDAASLTTGRSEKWGEYLSYIFGTVETTLFGAGLNAPYTLASDAVPHNTYIDFLYHLGMAGTAGLIYVIERIFSFSKESIDRNPMNFSVAGCMIVMWFGLSELLYFDFPFHLMLACAVWNVSMTPVKRRKYSFSAG